MTAVKTTLSPGNRESVRQAMSWLHTWSGLILGWLLFAIFLTGTLSFFRNEFNLWMHPEMHGLQPVDATDPQVAQKALDALVRKAMRALDEEGLNAMTLVGGVAANESLRETLRAACERVGASSC